MADLDVQTAQLIIQLARDDLYQLHDGAQNGGLLSDLEFALAEQEREFMQRWMNYGGAQFNPGTRARSGNTGGSARDTGSMGNGGNRAVPNPANGGLNRASGAVATAVPSALANPYIQPPSQPRSAVPEPQVHFQDHDDDYDSDLSPILSNTAVFSADVLPPPSNNNPFRPSISVPSSSNLATRNPIFIQSHNNGVNRAHVQRPSTPIPYHDDDHDVGGPSNLGQRISALPTVASISLPRLSLPFEFENGLASPRLPELEFRPVVEEESDDEDGSTSSVFALRPGLSTVECYFCKEDCPISTTIYTSCYHRLCQTCITRLIEICIQDETTYPPKCCGSKLQINELHLTDRNLHHRYELKVREYDTPAPSRVYCFRCSRFLDSNSLTLTTTSSVSGVSARTVRFCDTCALWTCMGCKRANHPKEPCEESPEDKAFKVLAKQKAWQTCPNCKAIVERIDGCNHMTCKCSMQFCYRCATRWKQCTC